ncbi:MAG: hypothetical protein LBT59_07170 [Clostridiales bacterium]|nr:hypothetical protein [Clostridiales bacterium]
MNDIVFKASEGRMLYYNYIPEGLVDFPGEIVVDHVNLELENVRLSEKDIDGYYAKKAVEYILNRIERWSVPVHFTQIWF